MDHSNLLAKYWKGRWERGETAWHQAEPEPNMVSFFSGLAPTRVLVPLCGKSRDLLWLASQGHEVVGVELSELACQSFFEENHLPFEKINERDAITFRGAQVSILNRDILSTTPELLG